MIHDRGGALRGPRAPLAFVRSCGRLIRRLGRDTQGATVIVVAIALPALCMLVAGSIDLAFVMRDKAASQNIADATALMGAKELSMARIGAEDRTRAYALASSEDLRSRATVDVTVTAPTDTTLTVVVHTHRQSFFGNLLPPGGFHTYARATATSLRRAPLCVMTTARAGADTLYLSGKSKMTASCLVHSDQDIKVDSDATLIGQVVEAVTTSRGRIQPAALTGVQVVGDPFTSIDVSFPSSCGPIADWKVFWNTTLPAGVHCRDYEVHNGATLTLASGTHYFAGDLELKNGASLVGASGGVTLVFKPPADLKIKDGKNVSLLGSQSGKLAGFVLVTTRDYNSEFKVHSDAITKITGAIYIPSAMLHVEGTKNAAGSSDWTVIAAERIKMSGEPNLVINANYAGSAVPVPTGVGPVSGSRLSQ